MDRPGKNFCRVTSNPKSPYYGLIIDCGGHIKPEDEPLPYGGDSEVCSDTVVIRPIFADYMNKRLGDIEKLYNVDMNLQKVEDEWHLSSVGVKAKESIHEALNACRRSKVYNYYLCLPLRANALNEKLLSFCDLAKQKLGGCINFVKRPHVTLALLNLVTDSDIHAIVKALNEVSVSLGFLQTTPQGQNMVANINGLDTKLRKGKAKPGSVLMAKVDFDETAKDVIKCYQDAVNKAFNGILKLGPKRRLKKGKLHAPTEAEAAASGIYITKSGQIEITFTDISKVDKNAQDSDMDARNQQQHKPTDNKPSATDPSTYQPHECNPLEHCISTKHSNPADETRNSDSDHDGNVDQDGDADADDGEYEYDYAYDTSNPHDFHMTILRHAQVQSLEKHDFEVQVPLHCVELRPRYTETCFYRAYTNNELLSFCGKRYDGIIVNAETQSEQGEQEHVPLHMTDVLASKADNEAQRFIFTF